MSSSLTPEQRRQRAAIAAHKRWATQDPLKGTEKARRNGPGNPEYFRAEVLEHAASKGETLTETEIRRRCESLKKAYFQQLAYRSARARSRRKDDGR